MSLKLRTTDVADNLTAEEREFLRQAERKYRANTDWFEFEDFAFGMRSPLFSRTRSHLDVLSNPLYAALKEMWLNLGVKQGRVASSKMQKENEFARRKASRGGTPVQERHATKKRNVAASDSPSSRRVSKGRT
jgi:hypothetical protein